MTNPQLDPDPTVSESMHRLADEIERRIGGSELPAYIGQRIREESAQYGMRTGQAVLDPGAVPMFVDWSLRPDGSIYIQMTDWNGQIFWRKHLRSQNA